MQERFNCLDVQPIQAFEHPSFRNMIDIAARATNGVTIPNRKVTREEIMNMFKNQLTRLKERLNVSLAILTGFSPVTALLL